MKFYTVYDVDNLPIDHNKTGFNKKYLVLLISGIIVFFSKY